MEAPFLLSKAQMRRIEPFFPLSHGVPKVDDRRIVSAIDANRLKAHRTAASPLKGGLFPDVSGAPKAG